MRVTTRIAVMGAAVLLLTPAISGATDILFLTNAPAMSAADQGIYNRLTLTLGYTVDQRDGHVATPAHMVDHHLLIVSPTPSSGIVKNQWNNTGPVATGGDGAIFRNMGYPIINMQNGLTDELGFTVDSNGGQGTGSNAGSTYPVAGNDINIVNPLSPLAAGLAAGFQPVFTANGVTVSVFANTNFSILGNRLTPAADLVARISAVVFGNAAFDTAFVGIVSLEQGNALGNVAADPDYLATAANRRIEFMLGPTTFPSLNGNGLALFDAAVNYGLASPVVPEPSSLVLAGLGFAGLVAYRLRSRRGR